MPENQQIRELNPEIPEVTIGIRNLRKVKIYPLSLADELTLKDMISKILVEFGKMDPNSTALTPELVQFLIDTISDNIGKIIPMVMEEETVEVLKDITNYQALEIVGHVYQQNFKREEIEKKLEALFGKEPQIVESPSERS